MTTRGKPKFTYLPIDHLARCTDTRCACGSSASTSQSEDIMAINTQKVLLGGIAAGVVMNVVDFVSNKFILGARMMAESEAFKPGMAASMMTTSVMISSIVMDLALGILLIWT